NAASCLWTSGTQMISLDIFASMRRAAHMPCVGVSPMLPQSANLLPRSGRSIGCRRVFFHAARGVDRIGNSRGGERVEGSATPRFRDSRSKDLNSPQDKI